MAALWRIKGSYPDVFEPASAKTLDHPIAETPL
jgi:hypothetical protein